MDTRDYVGASAFLKFQQKEGAADEQALEWLAYAYYHNWDHAQVIASLLQVAAVLPKSCCMLP